ncbi:unnamed protein product [Discosporangium mesarthrocarpum]
MLSTKDSYSSCAQTRGSMLKHVAVTTAGLLIGASLSPTLPAAADNTLIATKNSYFRYVPRILESMKWYQGDLRQAVLAEDWPHVMTYFEVVNTAKSDSKRPAMYQSSSSLIERDLLSPLTIWSQSFAPKGTGPTMRALQQQENALEAAMKTLGKVARDDYKLSAGETRGQVAMASWEAGRDAMKQYVEIANKGLVRQLRKIETPF